MLNFINILTVAYNSWCFESVYTLYYIYKAEGMAEGTDCVCCGKESFWAAKGLHLGGKRSPFGRQKGYIWRAKGVLLEGKRGTFGGQKESFWKTTVFTSENDGNFMGLGGITAQATAGTP